MRGREFDCRFDNAAHACIDERTTRFTKTVHDAVADDLRRDRGCLARDCDECRHRGTTIVDRDID